MFSNTIILPPLPKRNTPASLPPIHNSLWDYKFTQPRHSNDATPSPKDQGHYTLQPPTLLLPSLQSYTPESTSITINPVNKITKHSRKKKQCPECHLWFSNLSTHKSIHLTPENRPYLCKHCGRGFARSNDLFRHNKRHWKETGSQQGAFKCPFNSLLHPGIEDSPCHSTGVFSRCDTYKNHLKALHFEYPIGTKKRERSDVAGCCKLCGERFENVDVWLNGHVDKCQKIKE